MAEELRGIEPTRIGRAGTDGPAELHTFSLDPAVSAALAETAAAHGLTLNSLVQAVWAPALGHLTGSGEVVFGVTVAGRDTGIDTEQLVGMLMNTVPLRVRVDQGISAVELATRIQSRRSTLLEHDHLGLGDILAAAGEVGELFDTALIFENFPLDMAAFADPAAELSVVAAEYRDRTHYPLAVTVFPGPVLSFRLGIRPGQPNRFGTVDDIWSVISGLCAAVANRPHDPVGRIRLPAPEVLGWGSGASVEIADRTVVEVFEATAAEYGARTALWCAGTVLTYGELNARANRLARRLAHRGVGADTPVGIALPRSPELVVAFLAVLKLGAVCLPIHDGYPPERVEWLLRHTGAALILRDLGADESAAAGLPETNLGTVVAPDAPAWLMFTSGSTGAPKGVRITHRNIVARALDRIGRGDEHRRLLLHSPYTWDMVVYELWMPLLTGRSVAIAPPGPLAADDYRNVLDRGSVTSLLVSAGLFQVLAEAIPADLARVEHIATTGDVPAPAAVARVRAARPEVAVTNLYGPVEATAFALAHRIPHEPVDDRPVPIGVPVDNTGVAVFDTALRPVPVEVAGELYLSGAGVAGGYLRQPGLSAARFVADPHGRPGALMYRTGDLGRWDRDGRLHFLGRVDRQQKINGFRVEPGEVEAAIRREAGIAAAVVTARQAKTGKSLVAYVVGRDRPVDPVGLRARLAETLPSYLVPAVVVPLDELPLTSNGKIDIAALPRPEHTSSGAAGTQRQQILASVVAGVLGVDEIGVDDDFFALGGNSLSAIRLVDAVNTTFEAGITLRDLFETPTVAGLDQRLDTADPARRRPALVPRRHTGPVPLTPAQQRLWTLNYLAGGQAEYLMSQAVEIDGRLDVGALRAAVTDVIARHEILRTVLPYAGNAPVPAPTAEGGETGAEAFGMDTCFRVDDCAAENLDAVLTAELGRGFDVRAQPPLRTRLFRLTETRYVFLFVLRHIAGDVESLVRLSHELVLAYTARTAGRAPEWPSPAVQFADYTLWLRELMGEESDPAARAAAQARYWLTELAGLPGSPVLPTDHPRTERVDNRAGAVPLSLDADSHRAIARTARECSASTYLILHTALVCVLAEFGAGHDIPVGVAVSGRDTDALDQLVGCAVHTVVLRANTSGRPTYRQLVGQLRDRLLGATEHKEFPFDRLVALVNPPRSRHHYPLFQVATTFYRDIVADRPFGDATARLLPLPPQRTEFDLLLQLRDGYIPGQGPAGIGGELIYAAELFERSTIEKFADRMWETLATICADIDAPILTSGSDGAVPVPVPDGALSERP
ncbi:non-ribosomal peptide synthetase [Nocardia brevicatena]|uniref:non-ribosomal peptide synthetase n=1 Tax=Nocardia brevicatena TaxID=37327 RepID=UPI0002E753FB|nr:non-ribosomal peptide synthetase [Nocardia brevicatena]